MTPETSARPTQEARELGSLVFADVVADADDKARSWACQHDGIVFAWDEGRYFFRIPLGTGVAAGALEELTIDGVTYARSTSPSVPSDFDADKAAMWERAGTSWITANQPDTISLEGSPGGTVGCLSALLGVEDLATFRHVEAFNDVDVFADPTSGLRLGVHRAQGRETRLTLRSKEADLGTIMSWDGIPAELAIPTSVDRNEVVEVTREEFESFVG